VVPEIRTGAWVVSRAIRLPVEVIVNSSPLIEDASSVFPEPGL
jgi:hypothetical protein